MIKHIASVGGIGLALAFVATFFVGREEPKALTEVAPRSGMSYDELMALGPRVSTLTGVTLGSSRHVVYLLACSGKTGKEDLESKALQAGTLAKAQRLSDREAVAAVLEGTANASAESLKGC